MLALAIALATAGTMSAMAWARRPAPERRVEPRVIKSQWESYLSEERGLPAAILVDLAWLREGPDPARSEAFWVALDMAHPGRHGVGTSAEADRIAVAEQRLMDELSASCGGVLVGRTRAHGVWRFLFMLHDSAGANALAAEALTAEGFDSFRFATFEDARWRAYRRCLAPDADRLRWIEVSRKFESLAGAGETTGVPRVLTHELRFPDTFRAEGFAMRASELGFEVHVERRDGVELVRLERVDLVELERVHGIVMQIVETAAPYAGSYVGWKCGAEIATSTRTAVAL